MKRFLLIAALALASVAAFAETYTFSVGINDYLPGQDENGEEVDYDLLGCVNDANSMRDLFINTYGVKEKNTKLLLDKDATGDNFVDGIRWLLASAKSGDQVVLTYSGHGGQVEDPEAADGSGKTEVICMADDVYIPDTLIKEAAELFRVNGINATFIFDSCYSGGMSRDVNSKIKVANRSKGLIKMKGKSKLMTQKNISGLVTLAKSKQKAPTPAEVVFLNASDKDKPSKDISGLEGIEAHGLFTLLLLDILALDKDIAVKEIFGEMDAQLAEINTEIAKQTDDKDRQFTQGPNFEGSAARVSKPVILPN